MSWRLGGRNAEKDAKRLHVLLMRSGLGPGGGGGGGATDDHGELAGLDDDDHTQYGLVVFSELEPGGARAGTLWVVTA